METNNAETELNFHDMELDDRLLKAIAKLGWITPTLIQEKSIPLALEGHDVLIKARTGSGKTAAFAIPVIQKILHRKSISDTQETTVIILAPSRELCGQISKHIKDLTIKCSREVCCIDISPDVRLSAQQPLLNILPDIIVSTPTKIRQHLEANNINVKETLKTLVIDEADLIISFGHKNELIKLLTYFPKIYQTILASATLSEDVKNLKSLMLRNPVTLKLEEPEIAPSSQLSQYYLDAEEIDKASILCTILKLNLIKGKCIIFVNSVDRCYKLKLFLQQFKISSCVLNSELPAVIRRFTVGQFNQGIYDIIIASDEKALESTEETTKKGKKYEESTKRNSDKNYGVSRGIDFYCVANVINFDFPLDVTSYIHRAGRTARGKNEGNVLSFVSIREQPLLKEVEKFLGSNEGNQIIKMFQFKTEEIEAFRYRTRDAWKAATRIAVREARLKEIKQELFNSKKLSTYFNDHPEELEALKRDKTLHTVRHQPHLAHIPEYMVPPVLKTLTETRQKRKRDEKYAKQKLSTNKKLMKESDPLFSGFDKLKKKKKTKRF